MISVLINGIERKQNIQADTLRIVNMLTRRRDTCNFTIVQSSGNTYLPNIGQEVVIYDGATKVFAGIIVKINQNPTALKTVFNQIECHDYTRLLDRKLVPDTYTNMTINEIIADLKEKYFPAGFTINNVDADITINTAQFNYKPLSVVLQKLAELVRYDWYVDYDKDLHFFARESQDAPFGLSDEDGSYVYDSFTLRQDNSQIRNSIIVRGGEYDGNSFTAEIEASGTDSIFPLGYKYTNFRATLTGEALDVGIDYINPPEDHDALHNFNEKILRFRDEDKPSAGAILRVSGQPKLPVIVKVKSQQHIQAMISAEGGSGVYEYLIVDKSITSKAEARDRARAEINAYSDTLVEGDFVTFTSGLKAGQFININSASRGINESYLINQVQITQHTKDTFKYQVSILTTRTADLIDVLRKLLLASTDNVVISEGEVTEIVENYSDSILVSDTVECTTTSGPYYWQPGPGDPLWNFAVWG